MGCVLTEYLKPYYAQESICATKWRNKIGHIGINNILCKQAKI